MLPHDAIGIQEMEHIPEAPPFSEGLETVHVLASMQSELNGPFVSSEMFQGLQKELDLHGEQFAGEDIDEAEEDSSVDEMEEFINIFSRISKCILGEDKLDQPSTADWQRKGKGLNMPKMNVKTSGLPWLVPQHSHMVTKMANRI